MKYVLNDSLSNNPQIAKENLHCIYLFFSLIFISLLLFKHVVFYDVFLFLVDEEIKKNTVDQLVKARKKVQEHTVLYKERLKKLRETIDKYKDEICALQSQCSSSTLR